MMFLRSVVLVVLGSTVIVAFDPSSLEHLVDDADIKVRGATLEPISQCPSTASRTFHHDGLQKNRHAEATFHFDPPRDGCYLIEERHPRLEKCQASANTKVHVHYSKGLQAAGTVDQTPKEIARQRQDQWTFMTALPFYAGHPGNVTLSNEGTETGTLTVFDQVRFSWFGKDCSETRALPRRIEIRMTVDFQHIAKDADLPSLFGVALKRNLAKMAGVPENSLRLTGLRSGSIIAEFLVLPNSARQFFVMDDTLTPGLDVGSATHFIELLRSAVSKNATELCALSGGPLEGCNVELKDLGIAMPSVKTLPVPELVPEQRMQQQQETDTQADGTAAIAAAVGAAAAAALLLFALYQRCLKTKISSVRNSSDQSYEVKVHSAEASMEEGHSVEEKKPVEQVDDQSTGCPSVSDNQSQPSLSGDIENGVKRVES